jgi:hypothetical protein
VAITFDDEVQWDASVLTLWANRGSERIRCRAGRETINEFEGFTHATSPAIAKQKNEIADLLKPAFARKIEKSAFDNDPIKTVTVFIADLAKMPPDPRPQQMRTPRPGRKIDHTQDGVEPVAAERFIVHWIIDGQAMSEAYQQQYDALARVGQLFDKYGTELHVEVHLNRVSPPPSLLYNVEWLRNWNKAGRPPVRS